MQHAHFRSATRLFKYLITIYIARRGCCTNISHCLFSIFMPLAAANVENFHAKKINFYDEECDNIIIAKINLYCYNSSSLAPPTFLIITEKLKPNNRVMSVNDAINCFKHQRRRGFNVLFECKIGF